MARTSFKGPEPLLMEKYKRHHKHVYAMHVLIMKCSNMPYSVSKILGVLLSILNVENIAFKASYILIPCVIFTFIYNF